MRNVEEAAVRLVDAIKASEEYQDYLREREKVKRFPKLTEQIDAYRHFNFELQSSDEVAFEKIDQMEQEYSDFRSEPMVEDFLQAELAFCRMMQKINRWITETLDFE